MKTLPIKAVVYVPQVLFDTARFTQHLDYLVTEVGGYTATESFGGWRGADGSVKREEVVAVTAYAEEGSARKALSKRVSAIIVYLLQQGEEAVLVELSEGNGGSRGEIFYHSDIDRLIRHIQA